MTHWQSPYMHAYFPALNSYPSLLGDMLADGINCLGFTWVTNNSLAFKVNLLTLGQFSRLYRAGVSGDGLAGSSYWSPSGVPPQDTRYCLS